MSEQFSRTELLLGEQTVSSFADKRVAVFGVGGVGGYVCEALVRSGIGHFDLIDNDTVALSNLNRQIIATHDTIGRHKTDVMKERMLSINPDADVCVHPCFFLPENADLFPFDTYDYVVDAVDTVTAKIEIILRSKEAGVPVISAMGAGNKLDPSRFRVADIYKTSVCPLARVMRHEMKKRGIKTLKVVYSDEAPVQSSPQSADPGPGPDGKPRRKIAPGSTAFTPAAAGLLIASEVIKDLAALAERETATVPAEKNA